MRGLEKFTVKLERSEFTAGEVLRGCVCTILHAPLSSRTISVYIEGHGIANVTQADRRRYSREFFHFKDVVAVFDKRDTESPFRTPGGHAFFFRYRLSKNLPATYEAPAQEGGIQYRVRAVMKIPKRLGHKNIDVTTDFRLLDASAGITKDQRPKSSCQFGLDECTYMFTPMHELTNTALCDKYTCSGIDACSYSSNNKHNFLSVGLPKKKYSTSLSSPSLSPDCSLYTNVVRQCSETSSSSASSDEHTTAATSSSENFGRHRHDSRQSKDSGFEGHPGEGTHVTDIIEESVHDDVSDAAEKDAHYGNATFASDVTGNKAQFSTNLKQSCNIVKVRTSAALTDKPERHLEEHSSEAIDKETYKTVICF